MFPQVAKLKSLKGSNNITLWGGKNQLNGFFKLKTQCKVVEMFKLLLNITHGIGRGKYTPGDQLFIYPARKRTAK